MRDAKPPMWEPLNTTMPHPAIGSTLFCIIIASIVLTIVCAVSIRCLLRHFNWFCYCCNTRTRRYPFETIQHGDDRRSNTGLNKHEVSTLSIIVFNSGNGLQKQGEECEMTSPKAQCHQEEECEMSSPKAQCPICLNEFVDGQLMRVMPNCKHVFHVACIDPWLAKNSSCPNCRDDVLKAIPPEKRSKEVHVCIVVDAQQGRISSTLCRNFPPNVGLDFVHMQ